MKTFYFQIPKRSHMALGWESASQVEQEQVQLSSAARLGEEKWATERGRETPHVFGFNEMKKVLVKKKRNVACVLSGHPWR